VVEVYICRLVIEPVFVLLQDKVYILDFTELVVVEYKTHLFKAGSGINSGDEEADLLAIFVCDIRSEQWWSSRGVVISVSIFVSILSLIYVSVHSLVYVVVIHLV